MDKPTTTGSRSGNAVLAAVITALTGQGLIVDSTSTQHCVIGRLSSLAGCMMLDQQSLSMTRLLPILRRVTDGNGYGAARDGACRNGRDEWPDG